MSVSIEDIRAAATAIAGEVVRTPIVRSGPLSSEHNAEVFIKLETMQHTGSFKDRGALVKLKSLKPDEMSRGVITVSAGNHAQGVAYHAATPLADQIPGTRRRDHRMRDTARARQSSVRRWKQALCWPTFRRKLNTRVFKRRVFKKRILKTMMIIVAVSQRPLFTSRLPNHLFDQYFYREDTFSPSVLSPSILSYQGSSSSLVSPPMQKVCSNCVTVPGEDC